MFFIQKKKYFPLPDYDLSNDKVKVTIIGKIIDINYARKLAIVKDLSLKDIISLDKIAKGKKLSKEDAKNLRQKNLIEGRSPNYHISSSIAQATGEKSDYIKLRGFKDSHYKKLILEYINKYGSASKKDIDNLILDLLPNILDEKQKLNKVRNITYALSKRDNKIKNIGTNRNPKWIIDS